VYATFAAVRVIETANARVVVVSFAAASLACIVEDYPFEMRNHHQNEGLKNGMSEHSEILREMWI